MSTLTVQASRRFGTLSPLRYPGGKSALAGLFADLIDAIGLTDATYVEPYAGGIALLRQGRVRQLVINDIDPAVHAFWSSATTNTDALLDRVNSVPLTLAEWHRQRDIYRAGTANTLTSGSRSSTSIAPTDPASSTPASSAAKPKPAPTRSTPDSTGPP